MISYLEIMVIPMQSRKDIALENSILAKDIQGG